jgi:uncharacterized protein YaaQ
MAATQSVNLLVFASVARSQVGALVKRLTGDKFHVTEIDSQGGILVEATVSLLIGLDRSRLPNLLKHIRDCCHTRRQYVPAYAEAPMLEAQSVMIEAEVGGASVFVFDVERFEQL